MMFNKIYWVNFFKSGNDTSGGCGSDTEPGQGADREGEADPGKVLGRAECVPEQCQAAVDCDLCTPGVLPLGGLPQG